MLDELLNQYLALEKAYICNAFANGLSKEQATFVIYCEKESQIEKLIYEGQSEAKRG